MFKAKTTKTHLIFMDILNFLIILATTAGQWKATCIRYHLTMYMYL